MITAWEIYLIMQLDSIRWACGITAAMALICIIVATGFAIESVSHCRVGDEKAIKTKWIKRIIGLFILLVFSVLSIAFIPTSKTAAAMIVVPKIANDETLKNEAITTIRDATRDLKLEIASLNDELADTPDPVARIKEELRAFGAQREEYLRGIKAAENAVANAPRTSSAQELLDNGRFLPDMEEGLKQRAAEQLKPLRDAQAALAEQRTEYNKWLQANTERIEKLRAIQQKIVNEKQEEYFVAQEIGDAELKILELKVRGGKENIRMAENAELQLKYYKEIIALENQRAADIKETGDAYVAQQNFVVQRKNLRKQILAEQKILNIQRAQTDEAERQAKLEEEAARRAAQQAELVSITREFVQDKYNFAMLTTQDDKRLNALQRDLELTQIKYEFEDRITNAKSEQAKINLKILKQQKEAIVQQKYMNTLENKEKTEFTDTVGTAWKQFAREIMVPQNQKPQDEQAQILDANKKQVSLLTETNGLLNNFYKKPKERKMVFESTTGQDDDGNHGVWPLPTLCTPRTE